MFGNQLYTIQFTYNMKNFVDVSSFFAKMSNLIEVTKFHYNEQFFRRSTISLYRDFPYLVYTPACIFCTPQNYSNKITPILDAISGLQLEPGNWTFEKSARGVFFGSDPIGLWFDRKKPLFIEKVSKISKVKGKKCTCEQSTHIAARLLKGCSRPSSHLPVKFPF
jgi:hypothetical protein